MSGLRRCSFLSMVLVSCVAIVHAGAKSPDGFTWQTFDVPGAEATRVTAVNARGDLAGSYTLDGIDHGFLLRNGVFQVIDGPEPTTFATLIHGISATGELAGSFRYPGACPECPPFVNFQLRGFTWKEGALEMIDIPDAAYTVGTSITANGRLLGEYWANNKAYGFLLDRGHFTQLDMSQSPADTTSWSAAYGINARGDIVGWYGNATTWEFHGYLLRDGQLTTLDVPGHTWTVAIAINSRGDVILNCYESWAVTASYLWRDGQLTMLAFPGATWTQVSGINNSGDLVGSYGSPDGKIHGFIAAR